MRGSAISDRAVRLLREGGHPVDDHAQGACTGQGVHRLGGIGEAFQHREFVAHLAEDLDSLDGIDPQVGFHIEVEAQASRSDSLFDRARSRAAVTVIASRSSSGRLRSRRACSCGFPLDAACDADRGRRQGRFERSLMIAFRGRLDRTAPARSPFAAARASIGLARGSEPGRSNSGLNDGAGGGGAAAPRPER